MSQAMVGILATGVLLVAASKEYRKQLDKKTEHIMYLKEQRKKLRNRKR
jgi:hypothetical protein